MRPRAALAAATGLLAVVVLTRCSGGGSPGDALDASTLTPAPDAPTVDARPPVNRPNIVFVLTDNLSWNLVQYMPHVKLMQQKGVTFSHYFVTDSLCCPSRSSIFTGKYPHDTQVFTNTGANGGYAQFEKIGNATQTFAATLHGVGYRAAMMGKYLNGYDPSTNMANPGWTEWDVAGDGYPEYNYVMNSNGTATTYGSSPSEYLVDVLSGFAQSFVSQPDPSPFVLEVATFAPHAPYTPAPRNIGQFDLQAPRVPSFAVANTNPPVWLSDHGNLTPEIISSIDTSFNLRVEAVQSVDDMIGALMQTLVNRHLDQNTYIVFSSDNGYHMGEHNLLPGKMTAFDTDINVPLIVMGPGVPAGVTLNQIVENINLCPTFSDIAGTPAPATADGRSLLPLIQGQTVAGWRNVALVEHRGPDVNPMDPGDPDNEPPGGPIPNSYEAIRMANNTVFVEYLDGETEFYDITTNPYEMTNTVANVPAGKVATYKKTITAIRNCHDANDCWTAQKMASQ